MLFHVVLSTESIQTQSALQLHIGKYDSGYSVRIIITRKSTALKVFFRKVTNQTD